MGSRNASMSWVALLLVVLTFGTARAQEGAVPSRDIWVEVEGMAFHATLWNPDRPRTIVYLPGFGDPGSTGDSILHRAEFEKYAVLSIDPLNQGLSAHAVRADVVELMNRVILAFLRQEHIPHAYLIGHSAGALQALAFQLAWPERVANRVVLLDDGHFDFRQAPPIQALPGNLLGLEPRAYSVLELQATLYDPRTGMSLEEYMTGAEAYSMHFDVTATWPAVKRALLVTHDFSQPMLPPVLGLDSSALDAAAQQAAEDFPSRVRHGEVLEVPGASHSLWDETSSPGAPAVIARAIADFLR